MKTPAKFSWPRMLLTVSVLAGATLFACLWLREEHPKLAEEMGIPLSDRVQDCRTLSGFMNPPSTFVLALALERSADDGLAEASKFVAEYDQWINRLAKIRLADDDIAEAMDLLIASLKGIAGEMRRTIVLVKDKPQDFDEHDYAAKLAALLIEADTATRKLSRRCDRGR